MKGACSTCDALRERVSALETVQIRVEAELEKLTRRIARLEAAYDDRVNICREAAAILDSPDPPRAALELREAS